MNTTLKSSKYQEAIYDFVRTQKGNLVVQATAGSGKTTTAIEIARIAKEELGLSAKFFAFNRDIVAELKSRVGDDLAQTLNSLGNSSLWAYLGKKRLTVEAWKYSNLIQERLDKIGFTKKNNANFYQVSKQIAEILSFCQSYLVDTENDEAIWNIIDTQGLDLPNGFLSPSDVFDMIRSSLAEGIRMAKDGRIISYDDQLWLPVLWNIPVAQSEFVIVDEAQDLSPVKLELVLKALKPGGRFVAVGDKNQSIYAFCGADTKSIDKIIARTDATVLPLSVCYRCPELVVKEAQRVVAEIEHREGAPLGVVRSIADIQLPNELKANDLVLSRTTAPLVSLCIKLISLKMPAKVRGRKIGDSLTKVVKDALGKNGKWENVSNLLEEYYVAQLKKIEARKNHEQAAQNLTDKIEGVRVCLESFNAPTFEKFVEEINNLFSDEDSLITLSTVHRAKGLQYPRVFIIQPEKMPLKWRNQTADDAAQEMNILFVALTRAQEELVYVETTEKDML